MAKLADDFKIIDADTHYTEPHDLWTSRAPKATRTGSSTSRSATGVPTWVVDGDEIGFARAAASSTATARSSRSSIRCRDRASTGSTRAPTTRRPACRLMDECGIHAQVLFPNVVGLGGRRSTM